MTVTIKYQLFMLIGIFGFVDRKYICCVRLLYTIIFFNTIILFDIIK